MRVLIFAITLLIPSAAAMAVETSPAPFAEHPQVSAFIDEMASKHGFERAQLVEMFGRAHSRPTVIERMTRPAEAKPWYQYRKIFLGDKRIAAGAGFWRENASVLARAEAEYGVTAEVIVAIIGVETFYGRYRGKDPVLESLATLAFDYPRRGAFFRAELEQFLLLAREEGWDPLRVQGSYAGAMGLPQFIASSYRRLAIDFSGDGKRDLIDNVDDAIGSVANYLARSGWKRGETVAVPARVSGQAYRATLEQGLKPATALPELRERGIQARGPVTGSRAALVKLKGKSGPEYWLGLDNFYAITRYNHSPLYALAVFQLSEAVRDLYLRPERDLDGVDSAQMAKLQRLLLDEGHDPGPVDGLDGPRTRAAVASFQLSAGLPANGTPDLQVLKALAR